MNEKEKSDLYERLDEYGAMLDWIRKTLEHMPNVVPYLMSVESSRRKNVPGN
jgi:hypothetical protein